MTGDIRYWIPVQTNRYAKISKGVVLLGEDGYDGTDAGWEDKLAFLDETKASLQLRVDCLDTGMEWAEDTPSRTCHIVSNIELETRDVPSELNGV